MIEIIELCQCFEKMSKFCSLVKILRLFRHKQQFHMISQYMWSIESQCILRRLNLDSSLFQKLFVDYDIVFKSRYTAEKTNILWKMRFSEFVFSLLSLSWKTLERQRLRSRDICLATLGNTLLSMQSMFKWEASRRVGKLPVLMITLVQRKLSF